MTNRRGWRRSCRSAEWELLSFLPRQLSVPLRGQLAGLRLRHRRASNHDLTSIEPKPPTESSSGDTFLKERPRGAGVCCPKPSLSVGLRLGARFHALRGISGNVLDQPETQRRR